MLRVLAIIFSSLFSICKTEELKGPMVSKVAEFDSYWQKGKAEISSYDLFQARYGEMHHGEAVIIFETEDFSKTKQIKQDRFTPEDQKIPVLKMNMTKSFNTGIYPYSMMISSFVPAGGMVPWQAIKISATVNEWKGQTYQQLSQDIGHYNYKSNSYAVGDQIGTIDRYMTEDAVWNLIRINPEALFHTDSIMIIPSLFYCRLNSVEVKPYLAKTRHLLLDSGNRVYHIEYPSLGRNIYIEYSVSFPYPIVKWSEEYKDNSSPSQPQLTTTAILKKQIMIDYQNHQSTNDQAWRDSLDLKYRMDPDSVLEDSMSLDIRSR